MSLCKGAADSTSTLTVSSTELTAHGPASLNSKASSVSHGEPYDEESNVRDSHISAASNQSRRWKRCLGMATIALLSITIPLNLAILGFIAFLWYGGLCNGFWHIIIERNWSTRAVTVPILVLRTFGEMQAGAATAMIASLMLENSSIPMRDAAR